MYEADSMLVEQHWSIISITIVACIIIMIIVITIIKIYRLE